MKRKQLKEIHADVKRQIKQVVKESLEDKLPELKEQLLQCEQKLKLQKEEDEKNKHTKQENSAKKAATLRKLVNELQKDYSNLSNRITQFEKNVLERLEPVLCLTTAAEDEVVVEEEEEQEPPPKKQYKKKKSKVLPDSSTATATNTNELPQISYIGGTKPYECTTENFARSQFCLLRLKFNQFSGEKRNRKKDSEAANLYDARIPNQQQPQQPKKKKEK